MNTKDDNKLTSVKRVAKQRTDIPHVALSVLGLNNDYDTLDSKIAEIDAKILRKQKYVSGTASDKEAKCIVLCTVSEEMSSFLVALAAKNKDKNLKKQVKFSFWKFYNMSDNNLVSKVEFIINTATNRIGDLAYLNVTQLMIDNLTSLKDDFKAIMLEPTKEIAQLKALNLEIHNSIKEAMNFRREFLDYSIFTIKNTFNWYFENYWNICAIYDYGIRHESGVLFVTHDSFKNAALKNVVINVPNTQGLTEQKTGKRGRVHFVLTEGTYTYTATLAGFGTITGSFDVIKGETAVVVVTMVKI